MVMKFEYNVSERLRQLAKGCSGVLLGVHSEPRDEVLVLDFLVRTHPEYQLDKSLVSIRFPEGLEELNEFTVQDSADTKTSSGIFIVNSDSAFQIASKTEVSKILNDMVVVFGQMTRERITQEDETHQIRDHVHLLLPNGALLQSDDKAGSAFEALFNRLKLEDETPSSDYAKPRESPRAKKSEQNLQGWIPDPFDRAKHIYEKDQGIITSRFTNRVSFCEMLILQNVNNRDKKYARLAFEKVPLEDPCNIEFACVIWKTDKVNRVIDKCYHALKAQLSRLSSSKKNQTLFFPRIMCVPVVVETTLGGFATDEPIDRTKRKLLHEMLGFRLDTPEFRFRNCFRLQEKRYRKSSGVLRSPHLGKYRKNHSMPRAIECLIEGDFDYYHYKSGNYDDKGWGCAYRSLQMVLSWYHLAGYIETEIPDVEGIQEILQSMNVMDTNFYVGCKQWIGSQEVAWVIDSVVGARCRFIVCSSGVELARKGQELALHFKTEKTPVVICGSNLALTLIGIAWDENIGKSSFLIADPHYAGEDDLKKVQQKTVSLEGYKAVPVSWRGPDAFSQTSNYTICLPQRIRQY